MQMSTEQSEAEAAKAAEADSAAMDKLMTETLDQAPPPPETEQPPPETEQPPPPETEQPPPPPPPAETEQPPKPPEGEQPPPPAEEPDEFLRDLQSNKYDLPVGSTKKAQEVNKILRQQATDRHRMFRTVSVEKDGLEKSVQDLQGQLATAKKAAEELERYRPIVEQLAIEQDPKLNATYTNRLRSLETGVMANLRTWGLEEPTIKYIMQNGGPAYFSKDTTSFVPAQAENADPNAPAVRMTHKQFWDDRIMRQLDDEQQKTLGRAFDDEGRLRDNHAAELRSRLANRDQYFKDLQATQERNEQSFKAECLKELTAQREALGDLAKPQAIPTGATPAQKQRAEAFNAALATAEANFDSSFIETTPKALVEKNLGRLLLPNMKMLLAQKDEIIAEKDAQYAALEKKWNASLKAANTSNRQSVQQQPSKPLTGIETEKNDGRRMEMLMEQLPG